MKEHKPNQWGRSYQYFEYPRRGWTVEKVRSFMQIHNIMLRFWKDLEQTIMDDYFYRGEGRRS